MLTLRFTKLEIRDVVWDCKSTKSPT